MTDRYDANRTTTDFSDGEGLTHTDLNNTFGNEQGIVPIGAVIAWAKTITGVPALDGSFVECNGQVLSDADSPMNGETIPDLNGNNRLLRGNSTSGGTGTTAHTHTASDTTSTESNAGTTGSNGPHSHSYSHTTSGASATENTYDVVWIMRVK